MNLLQARRDDTNRRFVSCVSKQGIPIGNLTSQIFANIYLHEFDRFVRHQLKPHAYVRYGDDFVLFLPTRQQAYQTRQAAIEFLQRELYLFVNPKNDIVVAASARLKFLGHDVSSDTIIVDRHTAKSVLGKVSSRNIASYRSLYLTTEARKQLDWILLQEYVDI